MSNETIEQVASEHTLPSHARRLWWLGGLAVCLPLVGIVVIILFPLRSGIHVIIQNTGNQPLRSVMLIVTGNNYNLGDIPPGGTAHARVRTTGESSLEIQFANADGQTTRLDAGFYFEPGYRGTVNISINHGVIEKNEQNINL